MSTRQDSTIDAEAQKKTGAGIKNKGAYHPDDLKDLPPDGGLEAWTAAICSSLYCFTSWGSVSSYSVFLNFYLTNNEIPGVNKSQYAIVAGLTMCLLLLCGWLVSALLSIWPLRFIMTIGLVAQFVGMLLASFAVNYWELILTEGVLSGIGCGILFSASVTLIPSWFLKRRTFASGLNFAGTGAGGCVFALVAEAMIQRTGDQRWALRTIAIICVAINAVATFFVKLRKPLNKVDPNGRSRWQVFKNCLTIPIQPKIWFSITMFYLVFYFCLSTLGYIIILYSLSNFAVSVGLSSEEAAHALAILNACQFFGRLAIGIISDHAGRFNAAIVSSVIVIIFTLAFWIPISTYGAVIAFSVLMGLVMGYQFVTIGPIVADFFGMKGFPAAWCMVSGINSFIGLVAELIALALKKNGTGVSKPYLNAQIFTGVVFFVSTIFLFPMREMKVKNIIAQWKVELEEEISSKEQFQDLVDENGSHSDKTTNDISDKHDKQEGDRQFVQDDADTAKWNEYSRVLDNSLVSYFRRMFYPVVA